MVAAISSAAVTACGGGGAGSASPVGAKSVKRGIAFDLGAAEDYAVLAPGVSWWYGWGQQPRGGTSLALRNAHGMDFIPMLWDDNFDDARVQQQLLADPWIRFLLVINEPNLIDQANITPSQAAALWPRIEAVARVTGVAIVGPQITWGTQPGFSDPVAWLDAFYSAYRSTNNGRDPQIDYLGFHWYDYGLSEQLNRLAKYGKPFWVTEMANWHRGDGDLEIDSVAKQKAQMSEMVSTCESRADVFRYAWFTGRWSPDPHHTSLLAAPGVLSELGRHYLALPFSA